jgi:hypothetical protein
VFVSLWRARASAALSLSSLCLSLTSTHTHTHIQTHTIHSTLFSPINSALSLSLSHTHTHTHHNSACSLSHTHTQTHTPHHPNQPEQGGCHRHTRWFFHLLPYGLRPPLRHLLPGACVQCVKKKAKMWGGENGLEAYACVSAAARPSPRAFLPRVFCSESDCRELKQNHVLSQVRALRRRKTKQQQSGGKSKAKWSGMHGLVCNADERMMDLVDRSICPRAPPAPPPKKKHSHSHSNTHTL